MDLLFLNGLLTNYWYIVFSKPILFFITILFLNKRIERNNNENIIKHLDIINNRLTHSSGYINYINPIARRILNSMENSIITSQNNNIPVNHLIFIKERIRWAHINPIWYLLGWGYLSLLWKFYYSTRYKINHIPLHLTNITTNNIWTHWVMKFVIKINNNKWKILKYFRPF